MWITALIFIALDLIFVKRWLYREWILVHRQLCLTRIQSDWNISRICYFRLYSDLLVIRNKVVLHLVRVKRTAVCRDFWARLPIILELKSLSWLLLTLRLLIIIISQILYTLLLDDWYSWNLTLNIFCWRFSFLSNLYCSFRRDLAAVKNL